MPTKFLLTGGSGFIAAHILNQLLEAGHTIVTTVRSEVKAAPIRAAHASAIAEGRLEICLVPNIAVPNAFDDVIKNTPGIKIVIHTASPFHFNWTDPQADLVTPALNGTLSILTATNAHNTTTPPPAVPITRVVITSSFASILTSTLLTHPTKTFSEADWNPNTTTEDLHSSKANAYRISKTLAEKAAWDFLDSHPTCGFDVATICPPLVFGPVVHDLGEKGLGAVNTSNERIVTLVQGGWKEEIPETGVHLWVDVRDVATAHVRAALTPEAGGKRFFVTAGYFDHDGIAAAVRKQFPALGDKLPAVGLEGQKGKMDEGNVCGFDNKRVGEVLGLKEWKGLEESVGDAVRSFEKVEKLGI